MELSIIVLAYRMQREAPRTLRSLLRPLQKAVGDIDYEIIVIDNGSPQPLSLPDLAGAHAPVRLHRIERASPSPVGAINAAVRDLAQAEQVMICIDGARMASPYLVARTVRHLRAHPDAFVYVTSRHLGHKLQSIACREGYDQSVEDQLLAGVDWENDLDELFKISVWAGACRDGKYYRLNESNAFSMAKKLFWQMGGYNEGFASPGGGLSNLELFSRCVERPNAVNILLAGEATFHQFHGGAATSDVDFFDNAQAEHLAATGKPYRLPIYPYFVDFGEDFARPAAVGGFFGL